MKCFYKGLGAVVHVIMEIFGRIENFRNDVFHLISGWAILVNVIMEIFGRIKKFRNDVFHLILGWAILVNVIMEIFGIIENFWNKLFHLIFRVGDTTCKCHYGNFRKNRKFLE